MNLRNGFIAFAGILALTAAALWWGATRIRDISAPSDRLLAESAEAAARGEMDLAFRTLVKGAFYCDRPERFVEAASDEGSRDYLKGIVALRRNAMPDAERWFGQAARSASPLIAARARVRLEEMRYGAGIPNSERIPF